jgi:hypothetical protein
MLYMILKVVESSVKLQISEKLHITFSMQNQHKFFEERNN